MALLNLQQVASKTGKSEQTVRRRVQEGALPFVKDGARMMFQENDVERVFFGKVAPVTGPCRVIALANQKGGVGKTTTTANLAAGLALDGSRVLAIDCDPQGNLTQSFGISPESLDKTLYNFLVEGAKLSSVTVKPIASLPSLSLLGANLDLAGAEIVLNGMMARESRLRVTLEPYLEDYDYILLDSQPTLGILTFNVLSAATEVLIPVDMGIFSIRGVAKLLSTISEVRKSVNPKLGRVSAVSNRTDNTTLSQDVQGELARAFGKDLYTTQLRRSVTVGKAQVAGQPVILYRPSDGAAADFKQLAEEVRNGA